MSGHCLFAPSAASRWTECTASILFTKDIPDKTSEYAEEGSAAHEWAAWELNFPVHDDEEASRHLASMPCTVYDCADMQMYVGHYIKYVNNIKEGSIEHGIESMVHIPPINGFGTVDFWCINEKGVLDIIDLKYGIGVKVSAIDNKQMMLYSYGLLDIYGLIYDIHKIRMHIVQPRYGKFGNYSVDNKTTKEIISFGKKAKQKRIEAERGGTFKEGPWCWFCKGKSICPEIKQKQLLNDFGEDL